MREQEVDTNELVNRAQRGDVAAIAGLLHQHRRRLKRMISARLDPRVSRRIDASDVVQDALATAAGQLTDYLQTRPIPFYPWLRRIAWQKLVHAHERHLDAEKRSVRRERCDYWGISDLSASRLIRQLDHLPGGVSSPSALAVRQERQQRVREALESLGETDREVLVQRYVEQMSMQEIGASLGLSEEAVQMRHLRALRKLNRRFSEESM